MNKPKPRFWMANLRAYAVALSLVAAACVHAGIGAAWAQPVSGTAGAARASSAPLPLAERAPKTEAETPPRWAELAPPQRQALKPLADAWSSLSTAQKRKWIAMSRNFEKLSADEQGKLQARMGEWVALSASERTQARLNFAATKKVPHDEKQAKWQAYQALSDDERRVFADQAPRQSAPGAATAVRPVPPRRLTNLPKAPDNHTPMPRISAAPHQVDRNTLLPQVDRYHPDLDAP